MKRGYQIRAYSGKLTWTSVPLPEDDEEIVRIQKRLFSTNEFASLGTIRFMHSNYDNEPYMTYLNAARIDGLELWPLELPDDPVEVEVEAVLDPGEDVIEDNFADNRKRR